MIPAHSGTTASKAQMLCKLPHAFVQAVDKPTHKHLSWTQHYKTKFALVFSSRCTPSRCASRRPWNHPRGTLSWGRHALGWLEQSALLPTICNQWSTQTQAWIGQSSLGDTHLWIKAFHWHCIKWVGPRSIKIERPCMKRKNNSDDFIQLMHKMTNQWIN